MWIISGAANPDLEAMLLRELTCDIDGWDPGPSAFERVLKVRRRRVQARRRNLLAAGLTAVACGLLVFTLVPVSQQAAGTVASTVFGSLLPSQPSRSAPSQRPHQAATPAPAPGTPQVVNPVQQPLPAPQATKAPSRQAPAPQDSAPQTQPPVIAGPRATPPPPPTSSAAAPTPSPTCLLGIVCV
jgi:hypothetical protein